MDFRYELKRFIELNPKFKIPKADVRTVQNGKFEDIQMSFSQGKETLTLLFSMRGDDVGTVTYSHKGKNVRVNVSAADIADPVSFMTGLLGANQSLTRQFHFTRLRFSKDLAEMKPEEQAAYMETLAKTVAAMEKVQAGWSKPKKTAVNQWIFGEEAQAETGTATTGDCVSRGGWIGTFERDKSKNVTLCKVPSEGFRETEKGTVEICNPAVYGGNKDGVITFVKSEGSSSAAYCMSEAKRKNFGPMFRFAKENEVDSEYMRIQDAINKMASLCGTQNVKDLQADNCRELDTQIIELQRTNCEALVKIKGAVVVGEDCKKMIAEGKVTPPPAPAGPTAKDETGKPGPAARERSRETHGGKPGTVSASNPCSGLPINRDDLKCNGGNSSSLSCEDSNKESFTAYYCVCPQGMSSRYDGNSTKPTGCSQGRMGSFNRQDVMLPAPERAPPPIVKEKTWWESTKTFASDNWIPLTAIAVMVGIGALTIWGNESSAKQQIANNYAVNAPTTPTYAPAAVTGAPLMVSGAGTAFPTIPGRVGTTPLTTGGYSFSPYTGVPGGPVNGVLKRGTRNSATGQ